MNVTKPSQQQAELVRVLTSIANRRIKKMVAAMDTKALDTLCDSIDLSDKEDAK